MEFHERPDGVGRLYLCQPSYAVCNPQSARIFWIGSTNKYRSRCHYVSNGGSLLAATFNGFWAHALNLQTCYQVGVDAKRKGHSVTSNPFTAPHHVKQLLGEAWLQGYLGTGNFTHFAMLHDDIVPVEGWVDILIEDLQASGADVCAAIMPLKDGHGLTSTAIDDPTDPYRVIRRLSMAEVYRLPEVFTAADCGYPDNKLLLNTGCWVADIRKPWARKVRFTINDTIRPDESGLLAAEVASEDWNFSRDVQDLGGKVVATRRCGAWHHGSFPFPNDTPWGEWDCDRTSEHKFGGRAIGARPEEQTRPVGWHESQDEPEFSSEKLADVPGWLTDAEGEVLQREARGKRVLEIGAYCGRSTIWLASHAKEVHVIDTFSGKFCPVPVDTYAAFCRNIEKYKVYAKVWTYRGEVEHTISLVPGYFDVVFIDGSHDYLSVRRDIGLALNVLDPVKGGTLIFHDYGRDCDPGVKRAVDETFVTFGRPEVGSVLVVKIDKHPAANKARELQTA